MDEQTRIALSFLNGKEVRIPDLRIFSDDDGIQLQMTVACEDRTMIIYCRNVHVFRLNAMWSELKMYCFEYIDNQVNGYQSDQRYYVHDVNEEDTLSFYCEEIMVV